MISTQHLFYFFFVFLKKVLKHFILYKTNICYDSPMDQKLYSKYTEYQNTDGDVLTRLQIIGYPVSNSNIPSGMAESSIDSFDSFKELVGNINTMSREELSAKLKKCFKNYLKKSDIIHLLKTGDNRLSDAEIMESYKIMPRDIEGGVLVDDLIEILYK